MPGIDGRPGAGNRAAAAADRLESGRREHNNTRAVAKVESEARRARVLADPDLARRLTLPPLRLSRPENWNGWDTTPAIG
jgi:hypothetical protein